MAQDQHMQQTTSSQKLKARDFATLGIFSALWFVLTMLVGAVTTNPLVLMPWAPAICGIIGGPIYMLMVAKVHKRGAVIVPALVIGIVWGVMGGIPLLVTMVVFGIIGEVIVSFTGYKNFTMILIAYVLFVVAYHMGSTSYVWFFADYMTQLGAGSYPAEMVQQIIAVVQSPNGYLSFVGAIVAGVIGAFFGRAVLKKHFVAAGIVAA